MTAGPCLPRVRAGVKVVYIPIEIDDNTYAELQAIADRKGRTIESIMAEVFESVDFSGL